MRCERNQTKCTGNSTADSSSCLFFLNVFLQVWDLRLKYLRQHHHWLWVKGRLQPFTATTQLLLSGVFSGTDRGQTEAQRMWWSCFQTQWKTHSSVGHWTRGRALGFLMWAIHRQKTLWAITVQWRHSVWKLWEDLTETQSGVNRTEQTASGGSAHETGQQAL